MVRGNHRLTMYSNMHGPAPSSLQYAAGNSLRDTPSQMVGATSTMPSDIVDPYARPMAVRDLAADALPARSMVVKATGVQGNHGYGRQAALSQSVLQTNAFMRPQSASLGPPEAVMGSRKEGVVPLTVPPGQQGSYQNEAAVRPGGQMNGVRGGPSQFRYSTRSLSTQWLNGLAQAGMAPSGYTQSGYTQFGYAQSGYAQSGVNGASRCMVKNSPGQVLALNPSRHVIQVRYGTNFGYLPNGTPVGANGVPNSSVGAYRQTGASNRSLSSGSDHGFGGPEQIPGIGSRCEIDEPCPLDAASLCNQRNNRSGRYEDATGFRSQADRTPTHQGVPTRGASSLSAMVTQTGATTSLHTFADSVPGNIRACTSDTADGVAPAVRRQVKVDMTMVSALVDKMRNLPFEGASYAEDATSGNVRNHFEPRVQLRKHASSLVDVSKDGHQTTESSGVRTRGTSSTVASKPQSGVASKPPSGAAVGGLPPRNQQISQERLKRMPVTNTLTGSPFPTKPLTAQDLGHISNPRPLPPAPTRHSVSRTSMDRATRPPSTQKLKPMVVENGSLSSSCVDVAEEESLLGINDDTEFESLDDEDGMDDLNSFLSDEESSHGTSYSSPSPTIQSRARSCGAKLPAKSVVARRNHGNALPTRKISTGSRSAGNRPSPAAMSILLSEPERVDSSDPLPSLTDSLFSNIPPTINFVLPGQKVEPMPSEFRKLLKWRMSPITPNVVKQCIARSGFKPTFKSHTWLGYWGKHMKPPGFKSIRDYQKMNHFPGTFQLGRKDRLWRNLSRMLSRFGKKEFDFFPQTYILPGDLANLKAVFEDGANKNKWIIKPPASARGIGIQVVHKWAEIPKNRPVIVQRYLAHPYLINDSKFDLRIYVYVTSFDPLRIYVYEDGLARFASVKYSYSLKNLHNRFIHLTNYSVNKRNADYESNSDEDVCQGHKWSLKALWIYLQSKGIDSSAIWMKIKDLVIKTIISTESIINSMVKANVRKRYSCHELFGFDVLLDDKLKPWVIEVNISPSLHSNSQLDINVKGGMIRDLFNLAGFLIPEKNDVLANPGPAPDLSTYEPSNDVCLDRRLWTNHKSADEKAKHHYYTQRHSDEQVQATILDILTPDDIRMLTETVDENSRRGDFQRVFPSPASHPYQAFFEQPRYYNLLLQAWCCKYPLTETRGISMLESYCRKGVHLQNPTSNPKHQWVPPTMNSFTKDIKNARSSPTTSQPCLSESPYTR